MTVEDLEAVSERSALIGSTSTRTNTSNDSDEHDQAHSNHVHNRKISSIVLVAVSFVVMFVLVVGVVNKYSNYRDASAFWLGGPSLFDKKSIFDDKPFFSDDSKTSSFDDEDSSSSSFSDKSSSYTHSSSSSYERSSTSTTDENGVTTTTTVTTVDDNGTPITTVTKTTSAPKPGHVSRQTSSPAIADPEHISRQLQDKITSLPGLDYDPGFNMYSGYFPVDPIHDTRHIFYWYVESQSDPANDPVMFWTNGGPGCSGLYAFAVEHGPFFWTVDGKLFDNEYSWNKVANIIYVEIPIGVGFSYSTHPEKDYIGWGDKETAVDNLEVIKQFLKRFPERRSNDFYIASESYGGHYMPQLTKEVLLYNRKVKSDDERINFKGTLVGNPYVDPYTNDLTQFQTWYDHGLLPWPLYQKFVRGCVNAKHQFSSKCLDLMDDMYDEVGKGISPYGLDFPICLEEKYTANVTWKGYHYSYTEHTDATTESDVDRDNRFGTRRLEDVTVAAVDGATEKMTTVRSGFMDPKSTFSNQTIQLLNRTKIGYRSTSDDTADNYAPLTKPEEDFLPCQSNHLSIYMNRPEVVEALHANPDTLPWRDCSHRLEYSYTDHVMPQVKLYKELITMMEEDPFDFLIFSGDDDSICSLAGTQAWIWDIGASWEEKNTWNPWYVDGQTAGYVTQFDISTAKKKLKKKRRTETKDAASSFTLVTVHGAGHEVPAYRPKEALIMLTDFFSGKWRL